jgi:cytidylate kinase
MAVITISRQVAALGDEIATALAKEIGYKFIGRKDIEARIVELGFPAEKLKKYDERKPGFFASLAKDRDEYLDYLQLAVLEAAAKDNCILIGRGSFVILENLPNHFAVRFVANEAVRMERLKSEFGWEDKQAKQRISESAANRVGFHKSFFNVDNEDATHYHLVLNTGMLDVDSSVKILKELKDIVVTPEKEAEGKKKVEELLSAQRLVNKLVFEYNLNINFLHAVISGTTLTLQGVADSSALVEKAMSVAQKTFPDYKIESAISVVQDFKAYP